MKSISIWLYQSILSPLTFFFATLTAILLILWLPMTIVSWMFHSWERADLSQVAGKIAIHNAEYERVLTDLSIVQTFPTSGSISLNADSPVTALIQARLEVSKELVEYQIIERNLVTSIIARCNGPFTLTIYFFDNNTCAYYRGL